jgi:membrane-associated phospholipid phosphatase
MTQKPAPSTTSSEPPGLQRATLFIQVVFLTVLSILFVLQGFFPTLEFMFVLVVVLLVWRAQERRLLAALLPFFLLLITYQALRGFADDLSPVDIHVTDLIAWEKALFHGIVPAAFLQSHITTPAVTRFLDPLMNAAYLSHFVSPVILAVVLWYQRRDWYWPFILGVVLMSYAAFVTYLLFPAAPPWWATEYGYLLDQPVTLSRFAVMWVIKVGSPNPVAAMPSLHCAYPAFFVAVAVAAFGRRGWWLLVLAAWVAVSTVYLGHHWVIDIFAGWAYALGAFAIVYYGRRLALRRQA